MDYWQLMISTMFLPVWTVDNMNESIAIESKYEVKMMICVDFKFWNVFLCVLTFYW